VVPSTMLAVSGVIAIDVTAADVSTAAPVIVPKDAVIVAEPVIKGNAFATPPLVTFATAVFDEAHATIAVRFCTDPFRRVPVALNPIEVPLAIVGSAGDIAMDTRCETVAVVEAEIDPSVAVMVVSPGFAAAIKPLLSTVATPGSADCHTTDDVTFFVAPFP